MLFNLRSEVEFKNIDKSHIVKRISCPFCGQHQIRRISREALITKYQCWNKNCENNGIEFAVLNDYIADEEFLELYCDMCEEPFARDLYCDNDNNVLLKFSCKDKLCKNHLNLFFYNLNQNCWLNRTPRFVIYEDQALNLERSPSESSQSNIIKAKSKRRLHSPLNDISEAPQEELDARSSKIISQRETLFNLQELPLLSMTPTKYSEFLKLYDNKVVVLVDVPNFIRTLRELYPRNFEKILKKHIRLLLKRLKMPTVRMVHI